MMLRSSSTPVLGSLLTSFTDSPNNNSIHSESCHALKHLPPTSVPKLSYHQPAGSFLQFSCSSSPISPSISDLERQNKGLIRRVQSEGSLQDLVYYASCNSSSSEDRFMDIPKRVSAARQRCMALETIPSFSVSKHNGLLEEEEDEEMESGSEYEEEMEEEMRAMEVRSFSKGMVLTDEEAKAEVGNCKVSFDEQEGEFGGGKEMYLARGLGVDVCSDGLGGCRGFGSGGKGGGDHNSMRSGGNDGDSHGVEEYYKKMVEENPGNPLFLRNYANFLYQCKEDPEGAEEYYSRAILADPKDGEVLSQYGKLVWELHKDEERASSYFERAVQASPEDSHVHAAYASFLWDAEEGEDGCEEPQCLPPQFHQEAMATAG